MTDSAKRQPALVLLAGLTILFLVFTTLSGCVGTANGDPAESDSAEAGSEAGEAADGEEADGEDGEDAEDGDEEEKTPIPVEVVAVANGSVSSYITATANLVPENDVRVLAEWEGRVAKLNVEEGDHVRRGQVLAELARQDGEIALKKAQVREDTSRLAYERAKNLKDQELLSSEAFDNIAQTHKIAASDVAEAEWQLEKTYIRAPFTGRITERMVQPGQHVRPGDELFAVADFDPLIARIYLPEKDVLALDEGRAVRFSLKADSDIRFTGRIRQISPVVDTATGTIKVTIEATAPPRKVRPGAFVTVGIIRETRPETLLVPREAVVRELQKAYVFVVDGEVAQRREIALGLEEGDLVEATSGVAAGEQVITAGQGGLKDGSPIKVLDGALTAAVTDGKRPQRVS